MVVSREVFDERIERKLAENPNSDRHLQSVVRDVALRKIYEILKRGHGRMYEAVLLRLTPALLPKQNEITGADGERLFPLPLLGGKSTQEVEQLPEPDEGEN